MDNSEMQFSIKELRARKNETQRQVAESIGITVQTYSAWERSISRVPVSKVNALAKHFGVKLTQIFLN